MSKIRSTPDVFRISRPQIPAARIPTPMNKGTTKAGRVYFQDIMVVL